MVATTISSASMKIAINAELAAAPDLGSLVQSLPYEKKLNFSDGAGANQINTIWQDTRQIAASGTDQIDLAGGIADAFGNTLTLTKVKGIFIFAHSTNTNDLLVGGDANAFVDWVSDATDVIVVRPGAFFCLCNPNAAGYAVTSGTGDVLLVTNSAGSTVVDYDIILFGCE